MNPMTNMKNVIKLSEQELRSGNKTSWHDQYKDSSWIFVGGLPYDLTEGDIICVFSQYGEIVNINLVRDKKTGKQKGFCFICFEDQRSTVLTVDNLNGIKILGKSIRVDHVQDYKPPKDDDRYDDVTRKLHEEGCAPKEQIPERYIKREDERRIKREEEKPTRKRSPVRKISPDLKRVKKERRSRSRSEEEDRHRHHHKKKSSKKKKDRKKRHSSTSSESN